VGRSSAFERAGREKSNGKYSQGEERKFDDGSEVFLVLGAPRSGGWQPMKWLVLISVLLIGTSLSPFSAIAQHQHSGHSMPGMPGMEGEKKVEPSLGQETSPSRAFLLDGVKASFSIMAMADHKKMLKDMKMKVEVDPQATHDIAVTLTDTRSNQPISDAVVKMKIIDPKGKEQEKLLDFTMAMNQYSGDFTLSEKGRYQILILFKTGGQKKAAGFYYRLK
jgi:hypothetical protein